MRLCKECKKLLPPDSFATREFCGYRCLQRHKKRVEDAAAARIVVRGGAVFGPLQEWLNDRWAER